MVNIQEISITELEALQTIAKETFIETYAPHNTPESLEDYLNSHFNTPQLSKELNNAGSHFFLAKIEDETVGYLKVNLGKAQTELTKENSLEIERIYVSQSQQRKKIGQALFNRAWRLLKKTLYPSFGWVSGKTTTRPSASMNA